MALSADRTASGEVFLLTDLRSPERCINSPIKADAVCALALQQQLSFRLLFSKSGS